MPSTTDTSAQATAVDFARRIVPFWQAAVGSELLGVYLIGSLAHGGFSQRYSDIDMAVVTETGISPQTLDHVRSQAAATSANWGAKLSVFGPIDTSLSADSRLWIASTISIMRSYCWSESACGRYGQRWKRFKIT